MLEEDAVGPGSSTGDATASLTKSARSGRVRARFVLHGSLAALLLSLSGCSSDDAPETTSAVRQDITLAQAVRIRLVSFDPGPAASTPTPREFSIGFDDRAPSPRHRVDSGIFFECTSGGNCQEGDPFSFAPGSFSSSDPRFFGESYEYIFQFDAASASNTIDVSVTGSPPHDVPDEILDFSLTLSAAGVITAANTSDADIATLDTSCMQADSGFRLCWESDLINADATPRAEFRLGSIILGPQAAASVSTFRWELNEGPPGRHPGGSQPPLSNRGAGGPLLRCTPGGNCDLSALGVGGTSLVSLNPQEIPNGDARFFPVNNKIILPFDTAESPVEFVFGLTEFSDLGDIRTVATFTFSLDATGAPIDFEVIDDDLFPNTESDWEVTAGLPVSVTGNYGQYCLASATRDLTLCFDVGAQGLVPFEPAPGGARWIRATQFKRSVANLLGAEAAAAASPPLDPVIPVATVEAFNASVDLVAAAQYESNAVLVAETALQFPTRLAEHAPCVTQGPVDAAFRQACYREVALRLGHLAFRLPPLEEVQERLVDIGVEGEAEGTTDAERMQSGLKYLIATILQAPSFIYSVEVGEAATGAAHELNPFELVTRLSLFIQGRLPSEELLLRAGEGELSSPAGIRAIASEMLDAPEARDGFLDQIDELFQLKLLPTKGKDAALYPDFSPALVDSMREEVQRFVWDIGFDNPRSFLDVLTDERRFINADLAELVYDIPAPATEWELVDFSAAPLDTQKRAGIMTMPAMMTLLSHPVHNSIVRRGLFANSHLFCQQELPLPRVDTTINVPENGTLREFMESIEAQPSCSSCHIFMNRLGYAFENFDAMGRFRTTELDSLGGSHPVDASAQTVALVDGTIFGDYQDARQWAANAASLETLVSRCWVDQVYRNAVGAEVEDAQDAVLASIDANFSSSGHRMKDMLLEFVSSPAFTHVGAPR